MQGNKQNQYLQCSALLYFIYLDISSPKQINNFFFILKQITVNLLNKQFTVNLFNKQFIVKGKLLETNRFVG